MNGSSTEAAAAHTQQAGSSEPTPAAVDTDAPASPRAVVHCDHAAVRLGARTIWRDVTLTLQGGEFVAVVGPNGAGKSTLLKALLGLVPLAEGRVSILGNAVRRGNRAVSYLPQRRVFGTDVRIRGRDLVRLGLEGVRWGVPLPGLRALFGRGSTVRDEQRRVDEVIAQVGATGYANRPIGEVSGGEQQRLLIAQALVTRPHLLLLDEPLDSLDLPNQRAVASVIRRISQEEGVTVLLVAHDVNPILPALDRVLYLANGGAVIGTPEDVITTETLSRLYGATVEVLRAGDGRLVVVGLPEEVSYHAAVDRTR
jgi:zinc/manganese transport system ATP-binding protein